MMFFWFILFSFYEEFPDSAKFEISYKVEIYNIPYGANVRVWIPVPQTTFEQRIYFKKTYTSKGKGKFTFDKKYKNKIFFVDVRNIDVEKLEIGIILVVKRYKTKGFSNEGTNIVQFLKPSRLVPVNDSVFKIAYFATRGLEDNSFSKAKKLYDFVLRYMEYKKEGNGWGRGDFWYACDYRRGNCTDFHSFFIGLARSLGIPSFFEIGFSIPMNKKEGNIEGYHCWAYFYYEDNWVPVDISEADKNPRLKEFYFGNLDPYRISFTKGRDIILNPPQNGDALNYFIYPYVEIDGEKHKSVKFNVYYKYIK